MYVKANIELVLQAVTLFLSVLFIYNLWHVALKACARSAESAQSIQQENSVLRNSLKGPRPQRRRKYSRRKVGMTGFQTVL